MKHILSLVLILGLFFTTNAQADEIINSADMFATPFVELPDLQTDSNAIQITNDHEGLHLFHIESDRQLNDYTEGGLSIFIYSDNGPQGAVTPYEISWGGDVIHPTPWEPIGGYLPLRGAGAGGTHLQGNDNPPEGNHYDTGADLTRGAQTASRLVGLGKVVGHWGYHL
ncbi:hypothetical protein BFP77_08330 [Maribacter sp. 4U21]|uniref:hypothetical protein n=1 Tax=Maribacter sp. 4U21 TaxID=1889779 RepID=UPI000C15C346|nr:hypothetical protein [Maribacter sp. 4U21]PIB28914.1 hypothetical protein BFP77_08330 [Maribacter sp. 4U21]